MIINFFLNGHHYCSRYQLTIQQILNYLNYQYEYQIFVIEHNDKICTPITWNLQQIDNNDKIEIISIVGGG